MGESGSPLDCVITEEILVVFVVVEIFNVYLFHCIHFIYRTLENPGYGKDVRSQAYVRVIRHTALEEYSCTLI